MMHQSTCQQALLIDLPVESIPEPPVLVLPFIFLPPNGWAALFDDDSLLAIAQPSQGRKEIIDQNLHQEVPLATPNHVPHLDTHP